MDTTSKSRNQITLSTIMLCMGLFYPAVNNYIWRILIGLTRVIGFDFTLGAFDTVIWIVVIAYILAAAKKTPISTKPILFYLLFVTIALISFTVTSYTHFTASVLLGLIFGTIPFFLHGSLVKLENVAHKHMYVMAVVTLLTSILYSIYYLNSRDASIEDNMDFAYKVLPSVLLIVSWLFTNEKKKLTIVFVIVGIIFLMLQGTRGPLLCVAIYICLMLYKKYGIKKFVLWVGSLVVVASLLLSSQLLKLALLDVSQRIDSTGYSSRFIVMLITDEVSDNNGRDAIEKTLLDDIKKSPLSIRGLYADREETRGLVDETYYISYPDGTYAHKLWLEFIYDYGVIIGAVLLSIVLITVLRLVKIARKGDAYLIMLFVCTGFVHLLLSGSYLTSQPFFFLLGLAMNYGGKKDRPMLLYQHQSLR